MLNIETANEENLPKRNRNNHFNLTVTTIMTDPEPGLGKKILSFFINDADAPAKTSQTETIVVPKDPASKPAEALPPIPPATNQKFIDHFAELLEKENLPGPDYFEFKQALRSMDGLKLGDEKQFQAAWASFKAMGAVKDTGILKTSAEQYLAVLDKDRIAFLKDADLAIKNRVGSLQEELKKLETDNAAFEEQIKALQKKIEDNKNRLGQISGEVTEQSARINANKDSFESTHNIFVEQIKSDVNKINQYLK